MFVDLLRSVLCERRKTDLQQDLPLSSLVGISRLGFGYYLSYGNPRLDAIQSLQLPGNSERGKRTRYYGIRVFDINS